MVRFIADNTVGKLCRWLNLLGYDARYDGRPCRGILGGDCEGRIVLGRCPTLGAKPEYAGRFLHVESADLEEQIAQITRAFPLDFAQTLFTRCARCNAELDGPLGLDAVGEWVPKRVRQWRSAYFRCPACGNIYWEGTHTSRIRERLRRLLGEF